MQNYQESGGGENSPGEVSALWLHSVPAVAAGSGSVDAVTGAWLVFKATTEMEEDGRE